MSSTINRLCVLTSLALLTASQATAQNQFFPGAQQSGYVFNPLAGAQPVPAQTPGPAVQLPSGVWQVPSHSTVQSPRFLPGQVPNQAAPWIRPPVGPIPGQLAPGTLIDRRTGLPIQIATGQQTLQTQQPAQQQQLQNTPQQAQPQQPRPAYPWQMSPPAQRFWNSVGGYGRSYHGQSQAGYSNFGQNHHNQSQRGYSSHNQSLAGQTWPQQSFRNQSRFNQSLPNTTLHNVVVPYGRNWR
jgi:hypothetical protein